MNYDGYRFDGAAAAITMVNDTGYGNRDGALVDNTGGVTYSNCHFYGIEPGAGGIDGRVVDQRKWSGSGYGECCGGHGTSGAGMA